MSARQNFSHASEAALNAQLNAELTASYVYEALAAYFDRDCVSLKGFHKLFKDSADEERKHARAFVDYINLRGGRVVFAPIAAPAKSEWTPLEALEEALSLEKNIHGKLLELHDVASESDDPQLCDWLESEFLGEQVEANRVLAGHIANLRRCGEGLGVFLFDKELQ